MTDFALLFIGQRFAARSPTRLAARCGFFALAVVILVGCGRSAGSDAKRAGDSSAPRSVKVAVATETPMERTVTVIGSLAAQDQATLSAKVPGRLHKISVDLGSEVREGDVIAEVEPGDYELQLKQAHALLAQARARLGLPLEGDDDRIESEQTSTVRQTKAVVNEARKNRDRLAALTQQGIIAQSELETADATHEVAVSRYDDALAEVRNRQALLAQRRAEYDIAWQQLVDARIKAPFSGIVQERKANLGEYVTVGAPVITLVRADPLRLRLEVPERAAPLIRTGQKVRLTIEGDPTTYYGEIKRMRPAINEVDRMLIVEADVKNNGALRPGSFARAEIIVEEANHPLTVPPEAVVTFAGVEKAFVVENGKAVERLIETGRRTTNAVEVLSGLRTGESVVLRPGGLQGGQPVAVEQVSTSAL